MPTEIRLKVKQAVEAYSRRNKDKFPKYALVTDSSYSAIPSEMVIPGVEEDANYLNHGLGSERIEIIKLEKLEGEDSDLVELLEKMQLPIAFSRGKVLDGKDVLIDLAENLKETETRLA